MQNGGYGFSRRTLMVDNTPDGIQQPEAHMSRYYGKAFLLVFVMGLAVLLFLLLPFVSILEVMLIALGVLGMVWGVIEVDDRMHLHKVKQKRRELMLWRFKRQQLSAQYSRYRRDEVPR